MNSRIMGSSCCKCKYDFRFEILPRCSMISIEQRRFLQSGQSFEEAMEGLAWWWFKKACNSSALVNGL